MARDFHIPGEVLVQVKGGEHSTSGLVGNNFAIATIRELGLASEGIHVLPRFFHEDVYVDDFGKNVPPEVQWNLADATIRMTLVHYDRRILATCIAESMGGAKPNRVPPIDLGREGILKPAGSLMGNNLAPFSSGWHYISLNLSAPEMDYPWRFPSCYLQDPPIDIPLGTEKQMVLLNWRAIPYGFQPPQSTSFDYFGGETIIEGREITSSGQVLWDHNVDSDDEFQVEG